MSGSAIVELAQSNISVMVFIVVAYVLLLVLVASFGEDVDK